MNSQFEDKLRVCRIILNELRDKPCRWTPLCKATLSRSPTPWKFKSALDWLIEEDCIARKGRGVFEITDKGRSFLTFLSN